MLFKHAAESSIVSHGRGSGQPWPHYDEEQIADVVAVLRSGKVNAWTGPQVSDFETAYALYLSRKHTIALANGSIALDLALQSMDLRPGDEIIVTPRSFVASAACVPLAGGVPVFADVDLDSQNLTAATIAERITPRTRGVILVHLGGWPCEIAPILALAKERHLLVVEDCAQAHGARYQGQPVGTFGDIAVFSFCQDKIITTGGEGGLLALDDTSAWKSMWSMKDHGKSYDAAFSDSHRPGFRWLHERFGTNGRMTSIQAVLGLRQLERLPFWHQTRVRNALTLLEGIRAIPGLRTPIPPSHIEHAWYRVYAFVQPERLKAGWDRDRIMAAINDRGVTCLVGSCPEIYLEKSFERSGFIPQQRLPNARTLGETSLAFLADPTQGEETMRFAVQTIREVMGRATRG